MNAQDMKKKDQQERASFNQLITHHNSATNDHWQGAQRDTKLDSAQVETGTWKS
jgi:hypothetical protein